MISFENTENAFKSKSDGDLNRSYWLFKLIGNPLLVAAGAAFGPLALKVGFKGLIKSTIFRQFVGGENINDCSRTIDHLARFNIGTILDYSVEGKESEEDFEHCVQETIGAIEKAKGNVLRNKPNGRGSVPACTKFLPPLHKLHSRCLLMRKRAGFSLQLTRWLMKIWQNSTKTRS